MKPWLIAMPKTAPAKPNVRTTGSATATATSV